MPTHGSLAKAGKVRDLPGHRPQVKHERKNKKGENKVFLRKKKKNPKQRVRNIYKKRILQKKLPGQPWKRRRRTW